MRANDPQPIGEFINPETKRKARVFKATNEFGHEIIYIITKKGKQLIPAEEFARNWKRKLPGHFEA